MTVSKSIFSSCFILLLALSANAQENEDWRLYKPKVLNNIFDTISRLPQDLKPQRPGNINVIQDDRIARLDQMKKDNPTLQDGYRVQIFFGKRDEAQQKRAEFLRMYPDERAHISYLAPNFRLRVGDFRNRLACEAFKHELENRFVGCYIVKDKIELPVLGEE